MRVCIGLLTHCDSEKSPERFEIMKKCIASLDFKRDDVYLYVWDNASSEDVKEFLRSQDHIDEHNFSDKNLYDVVAVHYLVRRAEQLGCEYVMHLEDDLMFYDTKFWDEAFAFMDANKDCGCLRIMKYEYWDKKKYTKDSGHPEADKANWLRHFNCITGEKLLWEPCVSRGNYKFFKNNWHFYLFPTICRIEVFKQLVPHKDHRPLQGLEGRMMREYVNLGLKVGVLDGGVVTHLGEFNTKTSARLAKVAQHGHNLPIIRYTEVTPEVERAIEANKAATDQNE